MADSDDPCDDVVGDNLTGWIERDSSRSSATDIGQQLEGDYRDRYTNSWTRFEHD